jgi:hypothetical protein
MPTRHGFSALSAALFLLAIPLTVIPLLGAVIGVHWQPFDFCSSRIPDGLTFLGEGPNMSHSWTVIPLQFDCIYWEPETHVVTDFGTVPLLAGLALGVAAIAAFIASRVRPT